MKHSVRRLLRSDDQVDCVQKEEACPLETDPQEFRSLSPERVATMKLTLEAVERAMLRLRAREERVIRMTFMHGLTFEEAGRTMDISKERVRQLQIKGVRKLRCMLINQGFDSFHQPPNPFNPAPLMWRSPK